MIGVDLNPHMFRHTFSHVWLEHGGAEGDLMDLNGWKSPQCSSGTARPPAPSGRGRRTTGST
jgi:integrase/recombinase XerD